MVHLDNSLDRNNYFMYKSYSTIMLWYCSCPVEVSLWMVLSVVHNTFIWNKQMMDAAGDIT
jgi:hypothetical protein